MFQIPFELARKVFFHFAFCLLPSCLLQKADKTHIPAPPTSASKKGGADTFVTKLKQMHMESIETKKTTLTEPAQAPVFNEAEFDRNFKPKGAIAFFILLVILGLVIWYGIYFLMLARA